MNKGMLEITITPSPEDLVNLSRSEQANCDNFTICHKHLSKRPIHMFLASSTWSIVKVHLHPDIDPELVTLVASRGKSVSVVFDSEVDDTILSLLASLYPEKAGKLRRYYVLGKDIREVLSEV